MTDVARQAGVSLTTVSHVINGTRKVSAETQNRVNAAIESLDYHRNMLAKTLAGGKSLTIGLSISGLTNTYFGPLISAIERRATEAGYLLILGDSHDETNMERRVVGSLLNRQIDGIIVAPAPQFVEETAARIAVTGTPLVVIDRTVDVGCDQVTPENKKSVITLTNHLIEHGHSRIAAITGTPGLSSSQERTEGFMNAMEAHGLEVDPELVVTAKSRTDEADRVVTHLLSIPRPPTAFVVLNNAMTFGAMRAILRTGRHIPHDIALVAYDDFVWTDLFQPGLTNIEQDVDAIGRQAVEMLLNRINGFSGPCEHRVIDTKFHIRTSCGCPPSYIV